MACQKDFGWHFCGPVKTAHKYFPLEALRFVALAVPRPQIIAKYQHEMGHVDRHNFYRQGILKLHTTWKTKRWQTRIQLEILGLSLVDAFLAAKKLIPRWQCENDEESVFWKFVCALIPQIDPRPSHMRVREDVVDPTALCAN